MSVLVSGRPILSRAAAEDIDANNGIIARQNLVTTGNVAATASASGYPVTNLASPLTSLLWTGSAAAAHTVTVTLAGDAEIDNLSVARHNFASAGIAASVETTVDGTTWTEAVAPAIPPDDGPIIYRLDKAARLGVRLVMQAGSAAPQIAVMYVGALIVLPHRYWVGQSPLTLSREPNIVTGRSINGQFTGSIEVGGALATRVALRLLTQSFYRDHLDVLFRQPRRPFFFAWRPGDYPRETGYGVIAGNPRPVNETVNGLMAVEFDMVAVP